MKNSLKGKIALISGAAQRIGKNVALALAEAGVNIIIHYHNSPENEVEALLTLLRHKHIRAGKIKADLANLGETQKIFGALPDMNGPVDILINNAAVFPADTLAEISAENLSKTLNINAFSPLLLSQEFTKQTAQGHIINLLDTRITAHDPRHTSYQLSKTMLYHITRMLALECAPHIRVNAIAPGAILPPPGRDENYLTQLEPSIPLKAHPDCEAVNAAIFFLLTNPALTGQVLFVDGGQHLKDGNHAK